MWRSIVTPLAPEQARRGVVQLDHFSLCYAALPLTAIDVIWRDARFAVRLLTSRPGWTLASILCLAIATGANTAAFSVVNALILRPLPFRNADQLVMVALKEQERADTRPFSLEEYRDLSARAGGSIVLLARTFLPLSLVADQGARMVEAEFVSANYFDTLGIAPVAGSFPPADADRPGAAPTIVIGYELWQRRFGGNPAIVGRSVRINGRPFTVSAIAPEGFVGAMRLIAADLWVPAAFYHSLARSRDADRVPMFGVMGRMAEGATQEQVRAELETLIAGLWRDRGRARAPTVIVQRATGFGVPPIARGMVIRGSALIFGLMGLLIAVAAANVAALVLARAAGRRQEIGVRLALGASRGRVACQLVTESLVLALAGGLAGGVLAVWVTRVLAARMTTRFEYVSYAVDIQPDIRVLVYSSVAVLATAGLFGLAPVWHAARIDLVEVLKRSTSAGRRRGTSQALRGLVVGQFAVSTALLVGCGLLVRTYLNAQQVDPGIDTKNVVAASLDLNQLGLGTDGGRRLFRDVTARLSALPGVTATSLTRQTPLSATATDARIWLDEDTGVPAASAAGIEVVTADHFQLLGIAIVQGRPFRTEEPDLPLVAIVNETMARRLSPTGSPLGRRFRVGDPAGRSVDVVGVVKDVKYGSVTEAPRPVFYQPFSQAYSPSMTLLVHVRERPASMLDAIRREIQATNADLAIVDLRTLDDHREASSAFRRQVATALSIVSALGLLLSSLGLFGVVSYGVRERAREFGIRLALGARAADVRWMVLGQGLRLTVLGLAVGVALSVALTRVLRSMVFGVSVRDPLTIALVALVLAGVSLVALYLPARWATAVEPATVLRSE